MILLVYTYLLLIFILLDKLDKEPFKQLVLQRENVKVNAFWPIPEAYWPGPDLSLEALV